MHNLMLFLFLLLPGLATAPLDGQAAVVSHQPATVAAARPPQAQQVADQTIHPLTPLSSEEISLTVALLQQNDLLTPQTYFAEISLQEPSKQTVLAWQPGDVIPRQAFVVTLELGTGQAFEGVVDLTNGAISQWEERPGIQPTEVWLEDEIGGDLVKADPRWQAAMAKRGITDFERIQVDVWAAGYFGLPEHEGLRLYRAFAYDYRDSNNPYGRPIEGVTALVDIHANQVIEVIDTGVRPIPPAADFNEESVGELRPAPKPLLTSQPEGPTFTIENGEVIWQQWHFRFAMHPRIGLVLYTVGYEDGGELRPILYRAALGEIVVPYADPSPDWFFRNAFDAGEYGLGRSVISLRPGQECPAHATFFDATFADDYGAAYDQANVVCLFEVDAGDILWMHYDWVNETSEMRHDRKLILRTIDTTGNYDYGFDWIFRQDGSLEQRTQAMGIVLSKGVTSTHLLSPTAVLETRYGPLVGQNIVATYHQHFLNWRLDMDVDGPMNSVMEMNVQALPPNRTNNPWLNAFAVQETMFQTELEAQRDVNMATQRMWAAINMDRQNALGYPTGYLLLPGSNSLPYAHPQAWIRRRAAFMNHHLWVTPYQPKELYSAGDYPHLNATDTGLGLWTQANRPIAHRDLVLWYTMGLTHIPHSEEWPIMSTHTSGFKLVPMNFFDHNPALNLPADAE